MALGLRGPPFPQRGQIIAQRRGGRDQQAITFVLEQELLTMKRDLGGGL